MTSHLTLITGASRGLGLALAEQLIAPDSTLVCISRLASVALAEKAARVGATLEQWHHDLADSLSAADRLSAWLGSREHNQFASVTLINNACVIPPPAPLNQSDISALAHAMRVGLEAPMLLCSVFLRATAHWPVPRKILNISSGLGRRAMASSAAYCAAKAGMDHFTRAMALEEARVPNGAKVCSLAPGVIDTDMQTQLRQADALLFPDRTVFEGMHARGELSDSRDVAARVIQFLSGPDFGTQPVADIRDWNAT